MFRRFLRVAISASILTIICVSNLLPQSVNASLGSCTVDVSPHFVNAGSSATIDFIVTNTDSSNSIAWIRILPYPDGVTTFQSATATGWDAEVDAGSVTFSNGNIPVGSSTTVSVQINVAADEYPASDWSVYADDSSDGSSNRSCGGDLSMEVKKVSLVISNISTSVDGDSVNISWSTNIAADSKVEYGLTGQYGNSTDLSGLVTNHLIALSGLSVGTAYHYRVVSTENSIVATSDDNTFFTPSLVTLNTTPKKSSKSTESISPTIKLSAPLQKFYKSMPTITGTASDNEAIANVLYSLDGGKNWLPADSITGLGTKNVTYIFRPKNLKDNNYSLIVRAVDTSENTADTEIQILVIDRLLPTVGGSVIAVGSQTLLPNKENTISSLVGIDHKITLNAVGGPIHVTIVSKRLSGGEPLQSFELVQSIDSGLWSGIISFSTPGTYKLWANSIDGAGNKTSRELNVMNVNQAGQIATAGGKPQNIKLVVYTRDSDTNSWTLWDGAAYEQNNPTKLDSGGKYNLFLPDGTYYLKITASGQQTIVTRSFTLNTPTIINSNFKLRPRPGFDLGPLHLRLPWPSLSATSLGQTHSLLTPSKAKIIGSTLPQFNYIGTNGKTYSAIGLFGKPTILSFINTWADSTPSQLENLSQLTDPQLNVLAISPGESLSRLVAYSGLAGYKLPLIADSDNQLIEKLGGSTIPTTYFIDRHGVVKKVMLGVLSNEELLQNVSL